MKSRFSDLWKRVLIYIFITSLFIYSLAFSFSPTGKLLFLIFILLTGAIATLEYLSLARTKGLKVKVRLPLLGTIAILFACFFGSQYENYRVLPYLCFYFYLVITFFAHFSEMEGSVASLALSIFPLFYLSIPLGIIFYILYFFDAGQWWLIYLIAVTKFADTGGYFGGRLIGRNKLAPSISPNKTVEGFLCATLIAIFVSVGLSHILKSHISLRAATSVILGLSLGIMGQLGDLCESLLKRDAKIKDSSSLPGVGGTLDLLDSLLLNIPLMFFYLRWF